MSREDLDPELAELESALRTIVPAPSDISRDRVMFLAGQASVRRSCAGGPLPWLWPCTTAFSLLALLAMGGTLLLKDQPQIVYVERQTGTPASAIAVPLLAVDGSSQQQPQNEPGDPGLYDPPLTTGADWPPESMPIPSPKSESYRVTDDPSRQLAGLLGG